GSVEGHAAPRKTPQRTRLSSSIATIRSEMPPSGLGWNWGIESLNRKLQFVAIAVVTIAAGIYLNNSSFLAAHRGGKPVLLAHRGKAQRFDGRDLKNDT